MRQVTSLFFACSLLIGIFACSTQQSGNTLPIFETPPHRVHHGTGGTTPYRFPLSDPDCYHTTYCYEFSKGDTITLPVHVFAPFECCGPPQPPCNHDYNFLNPNVWNGPTTPWSYNVSPSGYNSGSCFWIVPVNITLTLGSCTTSSCISGKGSNCFLTVRYNPPPEGICTVEDYSVTIGSHPPTTPFPSPTPGIDIYDFNLTKIVTNTTPNAIVGQLQILEAVAPQPEETLSNCNWTLGGKSVGSYAANGSSPSPAPTSNVQEVQYYWIGSGQNNASANDGVSVTCTASPGGNLSASATYTVQQPTFTTNEIATYGTLVTAYPKGFYGNPGIYIAYATGPSPSPSPGVTWAYSVTNVPSAGGGQIAMGQLTDIYNTATIPSPSPTSTVLATTNGSYWLDGVFPYDTPAPYNSTWSRFDEPAQPVTNDFSQAQISMLFQDYFMYQPNNDNVGNSIWVTLAQSAWEFVTTANRTGLLTGGYAWSTGNTTVGGTAALSASSTLPTWSNIFNPGSRQHTKIPRRRKPHSQHKVPVEYRLRGFNSHA